MILLAIPFPDIDPVAVQLGPFAVRWYALAYIAGLVLGWLYMRHLARRAPLFTDIEAVDDYLVWATIGVVLGGRLGYALFYNPAYYAAHPVEVLYVWQGGMSFHGGFLGVIVATILFTRKRGIDLLRFSDVVAMSAPLGLFFGRIANFVNGELYGRASDVPWAVIFPAGGPLPRHPSQLYEAALEGVVLFLVLLLCERAWRIRRYPFFAVGVFAVGYGLSRFVVEFVRQPDEHLGTLALGLTMGQWLSLPMIALGLAVMAWSRRRA